MNDTSYLQEEAGEIRNRAAWLAGFVLLVLCFLLARAWYLQVFQGNYYRGMAENNRARLVEILPHGDFFMIAMETYWSTTRPALTSI